MVEVKSLFTVNMAGVVVLGQSTFLTQLRYNEDWTLEGECLNAIISKAMEYV